MLFGLFQHFHDLLASSLKKMVVRCPQGKRSCWSTIILQQSPPLKTSWCKWQASCRYDYPSPRWVSIHFAAGPTWTHGQLERALYAQGMQGDSLREAAQQEERRRRLLTKSQEASYTPGTGFNMALMQQKTDKVSACTQRSVATLGTSQQLRLHQK